MSHRIDKINSLIKKTLSEILHREIGSEEGLFITITDVETSRDLSYCKVWITTINNNNDQALELLNKRISHFQKLLMKKLVLKKIPRLTFKTNNSTERVAQINKLLSTE